MVALRIAEILLAGDGQTCARSLIEASVHLPKRGKRWVATFRDGSGRQLWKSTGLIDRGAALALARSWEEEARHNRPVQGERPPTRLRLSGSTNGPGLFTQREVALLLRISERAVREIERRAMEKLRRHPALQALWREWVKGEMKETIQSTAQWELSASEITAVYNLARTDAERQLLAKMMTILRAPSRGK